MKVVGPSPLYVTDPLNKEVYGKTSSVGLPPGRVAVIAVPKRNVKVEIDVARLIPSEALNVTVPDVVFALDSSAGVIVNTLAL